MHETFHLGGALRTDGTMIRVGDTAFVRVNLRARPFEVVAVVSRDDGEIFVGVRHRETAEHYMVRPDECGMTPELH